MARYQIKATITLDQVDSEIANLLADNLDEMILKEIGLRNLAVVIVPELTETEVHEVVE